MVDVFIESLKNSVIEADTRRLYPEYHEEILSRTIDLIDDMTINSSKYIKKIQSNDIKEIFEYAKNLTIDTLEYKIKYGMCYLTLEEYISLNKYETELGKMFKKYIGYYYTILQILLCDFLED